jgi:hypothetical protein
LSVPSSQATFPKKNNFSLQGLVPFGTAFPDLAFFFSTLSYPGGLRQSSKTPNLSMPLPIDNSLSSEDFTDLKRTLFQSNEFYRYIADDLRSTPLKNSARHRARELGLRINIDKAKACPQKAVSLLPLPIIENSPSPTVSLSFHSLHTRQHHYVRHTRNWTLPLLTLGGWSPLVRDFPQGGQTLSLFPSIFNPDCSYSQRSVVLPSLLR